MTRGSDKDADTVRQKPKSKGDAPSAKDDTAVEAPEPVTPDLPSPFEVAAPSFSRGDSIDHFRVVEKLGEGGMGVVLKAYDPNLDRHLAIKILQPRLYHGVGSSDARDRMSREAKAMAKVRHANVITVYSVGTVRNQVYIAMEFIAGGTLQEWAATGSHEWREIVETYTKAGHGLSAAHKSGLVHRDFKPANVLMEEGGRVLVTDFGLVSSDSLPSDIQGQPRSSLEMPAVQPLSVSLTQTGTILGTPPYMAPEQHRGDATDARADQFAFSVALYEALYGERPHEGGNYSVLAGNILSGNVRAAPPGSSVPTWLRKIVLRGLSVEAADRFESMDALLEALDSEPVQPKPIWRGRRAAAGITACIIGLVFSFAWARSNSQDSDTSPGSKAVVSEPSPVSIAGPAQNVAAPTDDDSFVLVTSTPPAVDLYRKFDGTYFGSTPLFLSRAPDGPSCADLIAKQSGYRDSEAWVWTRCGSRLTAQIRLEQDPKSKSMVAAPSRDSEPCLAERLKLSKARDLREVNGISEAWSIVSQCYAENGRSEEAAIAMGRVSKVFEEEEFVSDENKRKESRRLGGVNFRLARSLWAQKSNLMALLKARLALRAFRAAKSDRDVREVERWISERGSLHDITLEARGYSKDVDTLQYAILRGKVVVTSTSFDTAFRDGYSVTARMLLSGIDLFTQPSLPEMPAGEYTVCAQAETNGKVTAFRCKVVQHGGPAGTHFVIDLAPRRQSRVKIPPRTKPSSAPLPTVPKAKDPKDKEVESMLALAQEHLDAGRSDEAILTAKRAFRLKSQPMSFVIRAKASCQRFDLSNAIAALRSIPRQQRALRRGVQRYCKKLGVTLSR